MLRVDVKKQLGEFALEAAFESEGRVTGLFGQSGAGKTSLINMIAGLLRPDHGVIALDDGVLDDSAKGVHVPPHRRRIGYVFQDARLFPHLSVRRNLDYGRRMNALRPDASEHERITKMLDLGHLLDRRPGKLSGGERQRVAVARALINRPALLLADEPTGALDTASGRDVQALLGELNRDGQTIVLVTHDPALAESCATRIIALVDGRIATDAAVAVAR